MIAVMSDEIMMSLVATLGPRTMRFEQGACLFRLGDAVESVHFVQSGSIHLLRHTSNGSAVVVQRASAGSILAEASVFSDTYHCDAVASTAAETWSVARRALRDKLGANREFSLAWLRYLGKEVQQARLHAEIMSLKTVAARFDVWLAWRGSMPPRGRWHLVAAEIGVSPEALYREMARRKGRESRVVR